MLNKQSINSFVNINPSNINISNSLSISPYSHTYQDIVAGWFTTNRVINSGGFSDGLTQTINNVASIPKYVLLIVGTPPTGTNWWDRILLTQSTSASSYNSSTQVYTLGYNLVSLGTSSTFGTASIFFLLFC